MENPAQQSHTHLYIVVGLLLVLTLLFFAFSLPTGSDDVLPVDTTPLGLKRVILTAEQLAAKEMAVNDPVKDQTVVVSKTQQKTRQTVITNTTKADETYTLTPEQQQARDQLVKQYQ